ncbi:hypothetical protein ACFO3J_19440 [Streptomyces polygonati]|uniref:Uncharacterized protein n=1 Tax=Streptomyces polygonati TaxID=1617087 RepID=A0ABV8HS57_9ACTN
MFPSDLTDDPLIARGDKLIRWGAFIPMFGFVVIGLTARLLTPNRSAFVIEMLLLSVVGQVLVWLGMNALRRRNGWDSGVMFYIWSGGILSTIAAATTAIFAVMPIPLLAPIVATFFRWRMHRAARSAEVPR